mgnify:CR=1 FL=1
MGKVDIYYDGPSNEDYELGDVYESVDDNNVVRIAYNYESDDDDEIEEDFKLFSGKGVANRKLVKILKTAKKKAVIVKLPDNVVYDMEKKRFYKSISPERRLLYKDPRQRDDPERDEPLNDILRMEWEMELDGTTEGVEGLGYTSSKVPSNVLKLMKTRPQTLRLPNSQVINLDTNQFDESSKYFTGNESKMKTDMAKKGWVVEPNMGKSIRLVEKIDTSKVATYTGLQSLYHQPKYQNQKASVFQQYNYYTDLPTNIEQFAADIMNSYQMDFSETDKKRPNKKVLLTFGSPAEFRLFPLEDIIGEEGDLSFMIDNYQYKEQSGFGGSDKDFDNQSIVRLDNLKMDFYRIILSGTPLGGGNNAVGKSKWWFLDQPKTTNNQCIEGAIKRALKLKERTNTIRQRMVEMNVGIEFNEMVSLDKVSYYEDMFEINISVYVDSPHVKDGEIDNNRLLKGSSKYDKTIKILMSKSHFSLIKSPKKNINQISRPDCRILGLNKDGNASVIKIINQAILKEKGVDVKKLKEVAVIFDNETIFDKQDENFLKVYGVSWFLWDYTKEFNYNDGWNEDKTENKYHEEPYCYYKKGENCIDELIRFLLNPPEGIIYRPMGFNNSRFDNYSFCESAMKFKVLEDIFMADGSILYTRITGVANVWDASRFLVGMSLDTACKNYGTNPKKMPDLINHYEVQCYYEYNGWSGLTDLLESKKELVLYNKIDCICLASLIGKMRDAYLELFDEDVFKNLTISSMGYKICSDSWSGKKAFTKQLIQDLGVDNLNELEKEEKQLVVDKIKFYKDKFTITKAKNYQDDLFHRGSMFAGRTQSFFGKIDIKMPLAMCDVKSLYPTCMGNYGDNNCPMPYGKYLKTEEYIPNKLGIYRCKIIHQRCVWKNKKEVMKAFNMVEQITHGKNVLHKNYAPNVIPLRSEDRPLDWFYRGELDVVLTSVDIEVLKWATEDDSCIEVYEGHYWNDSKTELFVDFLNPAKEEKTNQDKLKAIGSPLYNQAKREGCKMISNSLSGKLLEAIHEDVVDLFSISKYRKLEQDEAIGSLQIQDFGCGFSIINGKKSKESVFNDPKRGDKKKKPAYLGMFVYAYARELMYKKLLSRYLCLYMDTDSACMPYFEWERCIKENKNVGLIDTGEYGCLEEEVCYTDKNTGDFYPANRLIGISPKNYAVLNDGADSLIKEQNKKLPKDKQKGLISKRKFKGVRKTDVWLPLSYFGEYTINENKKAEGEAVNKIKGVMKGGKVIIPKYTQDQIRGMRETKCCCDCIMDVIDNKEECLRCKFWKKTMKPAYSTEMFEELVNGNKIVVFCSMINRIKYRMGNTTSSEYIEKLGNNCSVEELELMTAEGSGAPIEYTISHRNLKVWEKAKMDFKKTNPNMNYHQRKEAFVDFFQRFRKIRNEKEIKDIFKLKQVYMLKII